MHLVLSVLQDLVVGLLVLLDRLLQLDAVDLDAELGMREVPHKMEHILIIHFLALQWSQTHTYADNNNNNINTQTMKGLHCNTYMAAALGHLVKCPAISHMLTTCYQQHSGCGDHHSDKNSDRSTDESAVLRANDITNGNNSMLLHEQLSGGAQN